MKKRAQIDDLLRGYLASQAHSWCTLNVKNVLWIRLSSKLWDQLYAELWARVRIK